MATKVLFAIAPLLAFARAQGPPVSESVDAELGGLKFQKVQVSGTGQGQLSFGIALPDQPTGKNDFIGQLTGRGIGWGGVALGTPGMAGNLLIVALPDASSGRIVGSPRMAQYNGYPPEFRGNVSIKTIAQEAKQGAWKYTFLCEGCLSVAKFKQESAAARLGWAYNPRSSQMSKHPPGCAGSDIVIPLAAAKSAKYAEIAARAGASSGPRGGGGGALPPPGAGAVAPPPPAAGGIGAAPPVAPLADGTAPVVPDADDAAPAGPIADGAVPLIPVADGAVPVGAVPAGVVPIVDGAVPGAFGPPWLTGAGGPPWGAGPPPWALAGSPPPWGAGPPPWGAGPPPWGAGPPPWALTGGPPPFAALGFPKGPPPWAGVAGVVPPYGPWAAAAAEGVEDDSSLGTTVVAWGPWSRLAGGPFGFKGHGHGFRGRGPA